jgi:hypothetical protein
MEIPRICQESGIASGIARTLFQRPKSAVSRSVINEKERDVRIERPKRADGAAGQVGCAEVDDDGCGRRLF